jgi:long-chain alkane monooxygenase
VFVSSQSKEGTRKLVDALRQQAVDAGRDPAGLKIFMGITVVVGRTQDEALAKFAEYARYASPEAGLAHFAAGSGIDYATYDLDDELDPPGGHKGRGIETSVQRVTDGKSGWTVRRLLDQLKLGGRYTTIVGDPSHVADALQSWVEEAGVDGFNLTRTVTPESYEDFIELVIPELQARGIYKTSYAEGTLREKLFGGGAHLPEQHSGAAFRHLPDAVDP